MNAIPDSTRFLAKKEGVVGRDRIHEIVDLLRALKPGKQGAIRCVGRASRGTKPFAETRRHQLALAFPQMNPAVLVNQLRDARVVFFGENRGQHVGDFKASRFSSRNDALFTTNISRKQVNFRRSPNRAVCPNPPPC